MSDPTALSDRLDRVEHALAAVSARLAALERGGAPTAERPPAPSPVSDVDPVLPRQAAESLRGAPALAGRTCLVLGGAFLIRSLTEAGTLGPALGVAAGIAYALLWLVFADREAARGRPESAAFHALASALIAAPLVVEAATRFRVLGAAGAALLLALVTAAALAVAWRRSLHALVWIQLPAATAATVLLLFRLREPLAFVVLLLALCAASLLFAYGRGWRAQRWPMALAADAVVLLLGGLLWLPKQPPEWLLSTPVLVAQIGLATLYLGAFVVRLLFQSREITPFAIAQTIAVLAVGFEGALVVGGAATRTGLAVAALAVGVLLHGVLARRSERQHGHGVAVAYFSTLATFLAAEGTRVLLPAALFAPLWLLAAVGLAALARHGQRPVLEVHAALLALAGTVASGLGVAAVAALALPAAATWPAPSAAALATMALAAAVALLLQAAPPPPRAARTAALVVALVGCGGLATRVLAALLADAPGAEANPGALAAVRSAVLAGAAVGLALAGLWRARPEHFRLAAAVLAIGGVKLLVEDLRRGDAAYLVFSLALYGGALIAVPALARRARRPAAAGPSARDPK